MRLTWLDSVGTVLVALILGLCGACVALDDVPVRGLAVAALLLGITAALAIGPLTGRPGALRAFGRAGMVAALGLGIATVVTGQAALLSAFVAAVVALWAVAMLAHAGLLGVPEEDPERSADELLGDGPVVDEARDEWERNRPGPFVPPGPSSLPPPVF